MKQGWKERRNQVIRSILILVGVGMLYAFFTTVTGWRIPCVFHEITGWYCPGCGVTRMCLSLLHLDLATAYQCNQALMITAPILAVILCCLLYRYIRYGTCRVSRWVNGWMIILIVVYVVFGVVRNLPGMEHLQPPVI